MAMTLLVQIVLVSSDNLVTAQVMMFLLGTTFAGKCIIGISYLIEFMPMSFMEYIVFIQLIVEPIITIFITLWY
jgi:predicted AAA+ superfamily ATPase